MNDQELLAAYAARDPEATAMMERLYGAYCKEIIRRILPDERDREECFNDVRLRVWNALANQRPSHLKGWLGAVARNCALSRCRQQKIAAVSLEESAAELADFLQTTPAQAVESRLLGEAISAFLDTQPKSVRIAFVRRYWYGDTVEQAACHLGWTVGKTKTVLHRMRLKLKTHLIKEGLL